MGRHKSGALPPAPRREVRGVLGGSRLLSHPEVAAEVAALAGAVRTGARVLVEIGFDHGRRLTATAAANPGWTVIGLEVRRRRVAEARAWASRHALDNLHAFRLDARTLFANALAPASLDVVEALFPTPWPAKRQRDRLLVTAPFLEDVARALRPGGLFYASTDVAWYADAIREAIDATAGLTPVAVEPALATRPACDQRSRREWRCARDQIEVFRFAARRRP